LFIDKEFGFLAGLRQKWAEIRDECLALPANAYDPWVQREMYGEGWSVYGLYAFGERIEPASALARRQRPDRAAVRFRPAGLRERSR
jgi:hypothetical protein